MKTPSKKTRDAAAKILSAVANGCHWSYADMALAVGGDHHAIILAHGAMYGIDLAPYWQEQWAEGEARLRNEEYP
jgi:hypothetical protein